MRVVYKDLKVLMNFWSGLAAASAHLKIENMCVN